MSMKVTWEALAGLGLETWWGWKGAF